VRSREIVPGLEVSVVGVGCNNFAWRIDQYETANVVEAALDAGITLFDTAESYADGQSERFLGNALGRRRDRAVIATKWGWGRGLKDTEIARGSPEYIRGAVERSLERLGTDYIDLYQYHRPDDLTPIDETLGVLSELVQEGKVRFIGTSNFSPEQVEEADDVASTRGLSRFVTAQNRYSLLERAAEDELIPALERHSIGLLPYYPLANGLLTGKFRRGEPEPEGTRLAGRLEVSDEQWDRLGALEVFGRERGLSLLDVAIGGLAAMPAVSSVIAGAMSPEQVRANAAAGAWKPTPDEIAQLRSL
jgi:aryl-alcohol dehydrogenase-like predicted oxidoreductase